MRKILFSLSLLLGVLSSFAQTDKEDWMIGGSFMLNTTRNTTFSFTPSGGYFFFNNFVGGGIFNLTYDKRGDNKNTVYGFGPFARYYFLKNNIKPFIATEYTFTYTKLELPGSSSTENGGDFFVGPGLAAFVNRNVAIETMVGYINSKLRHTPSDGGVMVRIGFQVYLSPRGIIDTYRSR